MGIGTPKKNEQTTRDRKEGGPSKWYAPFIEKRYIHLRPRLSADEEQKLTEQFAPKAAAAKEQRMRQRVAEMKGEKAQVEIAPVAKAPEKVFRSRLLPGRGAEILAPVPKSYWHDLIKQYRGRQAHSRSAAKSGPGGGRLGAPGILGTTNWIPIGPFGVAKGQPTGRPPISGRSSGIAISASGTQVYVIGADGGVWRSNDSGATWAFTMDSFDLDPTATDATSLACGAIAINPANPDRVYVGTGEGDTNDIFSYRFVNALPTYRGIGPVMSNNGGASWSLESADPGSPTLEGSAFYALAVDPNDQDNVIGATNNGLYHREPNGTGGFYWVQKSVNGTPGAIVSSVAAASVGGTTSFYAAVWEDKVYQSADGNTWTALGTGFPAGAYRIGLAVQPNNPNTIYALVCNTSSALLGVYRLDNGAGAWNAVNGAPPNLFGDPPGSQGDYDLTIEIDPNNVNVIYLGGSYESFMGTDDYDDASLYKGTVTNSGSPAAPSYQMNPVFIGTGVHPDVHCVKFSPGSSDSLWVCCDGGIFHSANASTAATFSSCNVGLGTLSVDFIGQHPTQAAVLFVGLQDNGTARYTGEEIWQSVGEGDGGHCIVNWNNPYQVLLFEDDYLLSASDGGQDYPSWGTGTANRAVVADDFVSNIATTPINTGSPSQANIIAVCGSLYDTTNPNSWAYLGTNLYISSDFGNSFPSAVAVPNSDTIYCIAFASATLLYAGSTTGAVYKVAQTGGNWALTRIDNVGAGPLPLNGMITDVAVDLADATGNSIYITFGGTGDYRHVWHFNGTAWTATSGPAAGAATSLLDVETNALVVDPANTSTLYTGADIGVWKSTDGGANWTVMENGLPDSAVLDLQIHQPSRLLRAALHGRGVFQYKLDLPVAADVELYIRDTSLDLGLTATVDWLDDPTQPPTQLVVHWESPNIKVDVPTPAGYQTPTTQINFYDFNYTIVDGSGNVATIDPAQGTVINRVYVEVHNRGIKIANNVQLMLLLANASAGLPPLPAGYTANVQAGTPITNANWQTVGIQTVNNLQVGIPLVAEFDLPSTLLPPPASLPGQSHFCLLAILHDATDDPFTDTVQITDNLTIADRKVGQKNLHIVQFVGVPPAGQSSEGRWVQIQLHGPLKERIPFGLVLDLQAFPGEVGLVIPEKLIPEKNLEGIRKGEKTLVTNWIRDQNDLLREYIEKKRFHPQTCREMLEAMELVEKSPLYIFGGGQRHLLKGIDLEPDASTTVFLRITLPKNAKVGDQFEFRLLQIGETDQRVIGGSSYRIEVVPKTN